MLRFVVIRGKEFVVGSGLNHTPLHASVKASSFEVKGVWCEVITKAVWDAQVGYNTMLSSSLSNHSRLFRSILSILAPLFYVV